MVDKRYTKCDFCQYHTKTGCMMTQNSYYCKNATDEFYRWLERQKKKGK